LSKRIGAPYIALDHIASVITPYIPEEERAAKLPLGAARRATGFSNDRFYARYSAAEALDLYLTSAATVWPGIRSFIRYVLDDGHELIMEGWQVLPRPLRDALTHQDAGSVKVMYLCRLDVRRIASGLKEGTAGIDWVTRHTRDEATFGAIAAMVHAFSQYIIAEASDCSFTTMNTDLSFEQAVDAALETLLA
ncbi:MAG: hypothetical protein ACREMY_00945, partial [bacterium]